jgi:hypothetical protein
MAVARRYRAWHHAPIVPRLKAAPRHQLRLYDRRFLQMCSHDLVEPVACTPSPLMRERSAGRCSPFSFMSPPP